MAIALIVLGAMPSMSHAQVDKSKARIAEEAFIYGFPMVMNYAVFHDYFIDKSSPSYKAPLNQLWNAANVYTPKDTAIVTPNSDTPYSFIGTRPAGRTVRDLQSGDRGVTIFRRAAR